MSSRRGSPPSYVATVTSSSPAVDCSDQTRRPVSTVTIRDARSGVWRDGPPLREARSEQSMLGLTNGAVLVVAGLSQRDLLSSSEILEARAKSWRDAGALPFGRRNPGLLELADGRVLLFGGHSAEASQPCPLAVWEPKDNRWLLPRAIPSGLGFVRRRRHAPVRWSCPPRGRTRPVLGQHTSRNLGRSRRHLDRDGRDAFPPRGARDGEAFERVRRRRWRRGPDGEPICPRECARRQLEVARDRVGACSLLASARRNPPSGEGRPPALWSFGLRADPAEMGAEYDGDQCRRLVDVREARVGTRRRCTPGRRQTIAALRREGPRIEGLVARGKPSERDEGQRDVDGFVGRSRAPCWRLRLEKRVPTPRTTWRGYRRGSRSKDRRVESRGSDAFSPVEAHRLSACER